MIAGGPGHDTGGHTVGPADDPARYRLTQRIAGTPVTTWYGVHRREELAFDVRIDVHTVASAEAARSLQRRFLWASDLAAALDDPAAVPPRDLFLATVSPEVAGAAASSWAVCVVSTRNDGLALDRWVAEHPGRSAAEVFRLVADLVQVMARLHSGVGGSQMVHRNLRPSSVQVIGSRLRLAGLGTARPLEDRTEPYPGLSAPWLPPEVAAGAPFGAASDVWGVGALTVCGFTGKPPSGSPDHDASALVESDTFSGGGDAALHITSLLDPDPGRRPTDLVNWVEGLAWRLGLGVERIDLAAPARGAVGETSVPGTVSAPIRTAVPPTPAPRPGPFGVRPPVLAGAAAALLVALVIGFLVGRSGGEGADADTTAEAESAASSSEAPPTSTIAATSPPPTTGPVATDDFDDRDVLDGGSLGWTVVEGAWVVTEGSVSPDGLAAGATALAVADGGSAEVRVEASVEGLTEGAGIVFRYEDADDYFALIYLPNDQDPSKPYKVARVQGGEVSVIKSFGGAFANTVDLGVDLVGDVITVVVGGRAQGTVTEPDGAERTTVGLVAVGGADAPLAVSEYSVTPLGT